MKATKNIKLIGISMFLVVGLSACGKQPGPAETAGKKIDQTADDVGKRVNESADKVAEKMGEQSDKTGVAIDDTEITAKIKAAILAESGLKTLQISVTTQKGVVSLSGSADSQANSDMAKALAAAVAGVTKVNNELVVKPLK
jgi:hyperosmotically inducible periplasmic protein